MQDPYIVQASIKQHRWLCCFIEVTVTVVATTRKIIIRRCTHPLETGGFRGSINLPEPRFLADT
jgi:hypothetical protein